MAFIKDKLALFRQNGPTSSISRRAARGRRSSVAILRGDTRTHVLIGTSSSICFSIYRRAIPFFYISSIALSIALPVVLFMSILDHCTLPLLNAIALDSTYHTLQMQPLQTSTRLHDRGQSAMGRKWIF